MEEEKREIKAPHNKQLIMDIGKTKYTVNLHFKQGTGETYKDKILKLIKRDKQKRYKFVKEILSMSLTNLLKRRYAAVSCLRSFPRLTDAAENCCIYNS